MSVVVEHCDHTDDSLKGCDMTIQLGANRVMALCRACADRVTATVLREVIVDAVKCELGQVFDAERSKGT